MKDNFKNLYQRSKLLYMQYKQKRKLETPSINEAIFDEHLAKLQALIGEQDIREKIIKTFNPSANIIVFPQDCFIMTKNFCNSEKIRESKRNEIAYQTVNKFLETVKTSKSTVYTTFMDPECEAEETHYVSVIGYPDVKQIILFDSGRNTDGTEIRYGAASIEQALTDLSPKFGFGFQVLASKNLIQNYENDNFCQTWSLIFLCNAVNSTYEKLVSSYATDSFVLNFSTKDQRINMLKSMYKYILSRATVVSYIRTNYVLDHPLAETQYILENADDNYYLSGVPFE